ncbi:hypothetical protein Sango_1881800 [Sesamum angolense]|uniref:Transposase-associated domain-containing protein n=1 Tax=Sesamum angolense TaxID=2727404 RepID=A0AAE1WIP6_9LAMI|nr:hypothetical protein Sango_1881800 [Sesamum angolense]
MYNKNFPRRAGLITEFEDGVKTFIEWAKCQHRHMDGDKIRGPFRKCKNTKVGTPNEVSYHLCMREFVTEYYNWTLHGEGIVQDYFEAPSVPQVSEEPTPAGHVEGNYPQWGNEQYMDWTQRMVFDATGSSYYASSHEGVPDDGTRPCLVDASTSSYIRDNGGPYDYDESGLADHFSNIVHAADQPLWDGCNQCQLGAVVELVDIKADGHISNEYMIEYPNGLIEYCPPITLCREITTARRSWTTSIWSIENSVGMLGTSLLEDETHIERNPRMLSLEGRSMCHPSDAEAWKHFDRMYPNFAEEPLIIIPYNHPPGMCMSSEYMFLTMVIPSSFNPKRLIDVYLEPLIEELLQLWHVGVRTYDHATDQTFMMWAALMWTVNDLPAYGMASGWSTAGVMRCPVCMDDIRAFHLQHSRKTWYFDCQIHFLPAHHPYRRNKKAFTKSPVKNKVAHPRLTGDQILDQVANISPAIKMLLSLPDGYGSDDKWTKKSIFWDLPY